MNNTVDNYWVKKYTQFATVLYFTFMIGLLGAGRAFARMHIDLGSTPIYITEIVLAILCPLLIFHFKKLMALPKYFLIITYLFFVYGCVHMAVALGLGNFKALRDVVYCGYMLFLPITYLICIEGDNLKNMLKTFILGGTLSFIWGRCFIGGCFDHAQFGAEELGFTFGKVPAFNLGISYGLAVCVLFTFIHIFTKKSDKIASFILLSGFLYLLAVLGTRTLLLSVFFSLLFIFFFYRLRFVVSLLQLLPFFAVIAAVFSYYDFFTMQSEHSKIVKAKSEVTMVILNNAISDLNARFSIGNHKKEEILMASSQNNVSSISQNVPLQDEEPSLEESSLSNFVERYDEKRKSLSGLNREIYDSQWWRIRIWQEALVFAGKSPFLGRGFGIYPDYRVWTYQKNPSYPDTVKEGDRVLPVHNHLITIYYKEGLIGLFLFLGFNVYVFLYGMSHIKKTKDLFIKNSLIASLAMLIYWHVTALLFDVLDLPSTNVLLWVVMGLILVAGGLSQKIESKTIT